MQQFRAAGTAIVFVSHHLAAVAHLCNTVLLLDGGQPIRMGPPPEVIAQYCGGQRAISADDSVTISATLRRRGPIATGDAFEVEPGVHLHLDVSLTFRVDVEHAKVGIVVWDLTRDLYVYGASSEMVGVPPIRATAGETRIFAFAFAANLTRGLYAIEVNVLDDDRHRFLAVARGIRHFHVVESVSYDGVANLYLTGREATAEVVHDAPSALAR